MLVYQLKILDLGIMLDPVFKTKESAELFKDKYKNRNIIIKEKYLEDLKDNYVYRIKNIDSEGYTLEDNIYSTIEHANNNIKQDNQKIVKEHLISDNNFNYELVEI